VEPWDSWYTNDKLYKEAADMKIQFIGATHEVTGSCTLLEVGGRYYLVDCGMEQGTDVFQNMPLPVLSGAKEPRRTYLHIMCSMYRTRKVL
jgi:predicted metal-dependent RNase